MRKLRISPPSKLQNWILEYEGLHLTDSLRSEETLMHLFTIRSERTHSRELTPPQTVSSLYEHFLKTKCRSTVRNISLCSTF
jgi:hypothetical protein